MVLLHWQSLVLCCTCIPLHWQSLGVLQLHWQSVVLLHWQSLVLLHLHPLELHWQWLVRNMACIWNTQSDDGGVEVSKRDMPMRRAQDDSGWI